MSENDRRDPSGHDPADHGGASPRPRAPRKLWLVLGAAMVFGAGAVTGVIGTFGAGAYAHGGLVRMAGSLDDPGALADRINDRLGPVLERLDASPSQRRDIEAIVTTAAGELGPQVAAHRSRKAEFVAALSADSVDRAALETIRQEHLAMADALSAGVVDTLASVAEVLTPEQRAELAEIAREHRRGHEHARWHGRERGETALR